jgi:hypothetical protein
VLTGLELVGVTGGRVLLILTIGAGLVRSATLELDLARAELERVARLLRERLVGRAVGDVRQAAAEDDGIVRDAAVALVAQACLEALAGAARPDVYAFGSTHAARHPELQAPGRLAPVLALIDSASRGGTWSRARPGHGDGDDRPRARPARARASESRTVSGRGTRRRVDRPARAAAHGLRAGHRARRLRGAAPDVAPVTQVGDPR